MEVGDGRFRGPKRVSGCRIGRQACRSVPESGCFRWAFLTRLEFHLERVPSGKLRKTGEIRRISRTGTVRFCTADVHSAELAIDGDISAPRCETNP